MSQPKDENVVQPDATGVQHAAGRVEFDSRGNSIWKWAKDVIESTSVLLKRLDNKDLAIEPTQKVPVMGGKVDKRAGHGKPRNQAPIRAKRASAAVSIRKLALADPTAAAAAAASTVRSRRSLVGVTGRRAVPQPPRSESVDTAADRRRLAE